MLAAPLNTWHDIVFEPELSEPKRQAASEGQTGHATKIWALAEGVPDHLVAVGWGGGLNWVSTEFVLPGGQSAGRLRHGPRAARRTSRDDIRRAIQRFVPGARIVATDAHDWNADEFSQGTWMSYRPGQLTRFHSAFQETEGRLAFAGSDLALGWAGWMDGAVETGARAAAQVEEMLLVASGRLGMSARYQRLSVEQMSGLPPSRRCNSSPLRWSHLYAPPRTLRRVDMPKIVVPTPSSTPTVG